MKCKCIFISSYIDREDEVLKDSKGPVSHANSLLQKKYLEIFFNLFDDLIVFNMPNIGAYPLRYRKWFYRGGQSDGNNITLGFFNIILFKHFYKFFALLFLMVRKLDKREESFIFIYDIYYPFLICNLVLKFFGFNVRTILIVPDVNGFTSDRDDIKNKLYKLIDNIFVNLFHKYIDKYIIISDFMKELIPLDNKKYMVIEGITCKYSEYERKCSSGKKFVFSYVGALNRKNKVDLIVDAFMKMDSNRFELIICGDGELKEYIEDRAKSNSSLIYKGLVSNNQVLRFYRECDLVLSLRDKEDSFTKYSFPSKVLEYMANGVPVLITRLQGIPKEYYEKCFVLEELSVDGLVNKIEEISRINYLYLEEFSREAKKFVDENKSISAVKIKIKDFIKDEE